MRNRTLFSRLASFFGIALLALTVLSCASQAKSDTNTDGHTSANSLDVYGTYRGILPCADCEGIKTTIYLNTDDTFKTVMQYIGRDGTYETTGKMAWDEKGGSILLTDQDGKPAGRYQVGENTLTQLDLKGNKITGPLASSSILTKSNYRLLDKKWTLVELMGKPVEPSSTMKKDAFIIFNDADNRYSASAGCNSISGNFRVEGFNKLTLSKGMSTLMACPDMTLEDELTKVLETADSFIVNGDELQLVKGRMAPLARFKIPMNR